jgi:hypothetical protein
MKTHVCNGHQLLGEKQFRHGDELPPALLDGALLDYWLDRKWAIELDASERRSLYRLFAPFSGATESEPLDDELRRFAV